MGGGVLLGISEGQSALRWYIVGSNIFNSLVVLPAAAIIQPLPVPRGGDLDLAVVFVFVLVVIPLFVFSNARLGRAAGACLLLSYGAYLVFRFNVA